MKREIKFRAWDERWEVMYENFQFIKSGDENNDWIVFTASNIPFDSNWKDNPFLRQQLKIMQYTGLKDKEGTEIYEGDIVICHPKHKYGIRKIEIDLYNGFNNGDGGFFEVIGNIYQHPNLIKQ